jgi:hypothetical protein
MSLDDRKNLADEIKQKVKAIECHTEGCIQQTNCGKLTNFG